MIRRPPSSPLFPYPTLSRPPLYARQDTPLDERARPLVSTQHGLQIWVRARHVAVERGLDHVSDLGEAKLLLEEELDRDRKSTRLNSSHANISYAVFCLKKKY